jgi:hypothetical protein
MESKTLLQRFLHILRTGYRHVEPQQPDIHWQHDVMRAVRHIGPLTTAANPLEFMNWFVWRFASVAGVCVLILSGYVAVVGFSPETGVVNQFLENPVGFLLLQAIGGY